MRFSEVILGPNGLDEHYTSATLILHEDFQLFSIQNDIGLINLETKVAFKGRQVKSN